MQSLAHHLIFVAVTPFFSVRPKWSTVCSTSTRYLWDVLRPRASFTQCSALLWGG